MKLLNKRVAQIIHYLLKKVELSVELLDSIIYIRLYFHSIKIIEWKWNLLTQLPF